MRRNHDGESLLFHIFLIYREEPINSDSTMSQGSTSQDHQIDQPSISDIPAKENSDPASVACSSYTPTQPAEKTKNGLLLDSRKRPRTSSISSNRAAADHRVTAKGKAPGNVSFVETTYSGGKVISASVVVPTTTKQPSDNDGVTSLGSSRRSRINRTTERPRARRDDKDNTNELLPLDSTPAEKTIDGAAWPVPAGQQRVMSSSGISHEPTSTGGTTSEQVHLYSFQDDFKFDNRKQVCESKEATLMP